MAVFPIELIVERAFRKIGLKAEDEALSADQVANGRAILEDMIAAWPSYGIVIDPAPITDPPDGNVTLDAQFFEPTYHLLAARLAPDYGVQVAFDADAFLRRLMDATAIVDAATFDAALTRTASQVRQW